MNKKMMIATAVALLGMGHANAYLITIDDLVFTPDGVTGTVMVDGKAKSGATLSFDNKTVYEGEVPTEIGPTSQKSLTLGVSIDLDGNAATNTDIIKFDLNAQAQVEKITTTPSQFFPFGETTVGLKGNQWKGNNAGLKNAQSGLQFTLSNATDAKGNAANDMDMTGVQLKGTGEKTFTLNGVDEVINGNTFLDASTTSEQLTVLVKNTSDSVYHATGLGIALDVAAIPEPATLGLLGLAGAGLMAFRRRHNR